MESSLLWVHPAIMDRVPKTHRLESILHHAESTDSNDRFAGEASDRRSFQWGFVEETRKYVHGNHTQAEQAHRLDETWMASC